MRTRRSPKNQERLWRELGGVKKSKPKKRRKRPSAKVPVFEPVCGVDFHPSRMSKEERKKAVQMAIGRLFRIMSRPYQQGDVKQYEDCRSVILNLGDPGSGV